MKDNFTKIQEKLKTRENIQKDNRTELKTKQAIQYKAQNKWKKQPDKQRKNRNNRRKQRKNAK